MSLRIEKRKTKLRNSSQSQFHNWKNRETCIVASDMDTSEGAASLRGRSPGGRAGRRGGTSRVPGERLLRRPKKVNPILLSMLTMAAEFWEKFEGPGERPDSEEETGQQNTLIKETYSGPAERRRAMRFVQVLIFCWITIAVGAISLGHCRASKMMPLQVLLLGMYGQFPVLFQLLIIHWRDDQDENTIKKLKIYTIFALLHIVNMFCQLTYNLYYLGMPSFDKLDLNYCEFYFFYFTLISETVCIGLIIRYIKVVAIAVIRLPVTVHDLYRDHIR
ncbi:hypothetical protein NPIL_417451 [Nephila pilipes]|uniref:Uncharacterized protein n=1 Tax=Nephila pilipes TaxID=299642 RepID=A0A8X6MS71_NEPPI|nr:hypothetical protein NPIL_417451 [Nephila pilipes]